MILKAGKEKKEGRKDEWRKRRGPGRTRAGTGVAQAKNASAKAYIDWI